MSLFKPACEEAYRKIFYDASLTWCLLGYEGKMIDLYATGTGGISEMKEKLDDKLILYALIRLNQADSLGDVRRVKFCFIVWAGESASPLKRGRIVLHKSQVATLFRGYHVERHVTDLEELSTLEEDLNEQLIKASGANYDLGNIRSGVTRCETKMYKQASKAFFQDKEKSSSAYSGASEAADQEKSRTPSGSLQTEEEEATERKDVVDEGGSEPIVPLIEHDSSAGGKDNVFDNAAPLTPEKEEVMSPDSSCAAPTDGVSAKEEDEHVSYEDYSIETMEHDDSESKDYHTAEDSSKENTVDANMNEVAAEQSNQEDRTMILDEASEENTLVSESLLDTVISDVLKDDEQNAESSAEKAEREDEHIFLALDVTEILDHSHQQQQQPQFQEEDTSGECKDEEESISCGEDVKTSPHIESTTILNEEADVAESVISENRDLGHGESQGTLSEAEPNSLKNPVTIAEEVTSIDNSYDEQPAKPSTTGSMDIANMLDTSKSTADNGPDERDAIERERAFELGA